MAQIIVEARPHAVALDTHKAALIAGGVLTVVMYFVFYLVLKV